MDNNKITPVLLEWVPVKEKLPDNDSYVIVTIRVHDREPKVRSSYYIKYEDRDYGLFINDNGDTWRSTDEEVMAWMYTPQPYKENKNADSN